MGACQVADREFMSPIGATNEQAQGPFRVVALESICHVRNESRGTTRYRRKPAATGGTEFEQRCFEGVTASHGKIILDKDLASNQLDFCELGVGILAYTVFKDGTETGGLGETCRMGVWVQTKGGGKTRIVLGIEGPERALYLEHLFKKHLGITDRPVREKVPGWLSDRPP